jgi:alkanesulfonate monooxygenase SsuD/methylene tetrahydromethanopterin reductase-like flavin-dependent oxidoreductase (luciferase family)
MAADLEPKPATPIPIWLGTYGNRALDATGRLADGWIPSFGFAPPEQAATMRERILAAAAAAGRDPADITCVYNVPVWIDGPEADADVITGPASAVAGRLAGLVQQGFTSMNFSPAGPDPLAQAELLSGQVLPVLRGV